MAGNTSSFCYLACTPSKASNWAPISAFMRNLGGSSFNKFFWRIPSSRLRAALSYPGLPKAFVLRRSREVIRPEATECMNSPKLGSFVVVAYRLTDPSRKTRKMVQRALQRAPCFRLCPSVYAFPQLRTKKGTKHQISIGRPNDKHGIITLHELTEVLTRCNARLVRVSRLVLLDRSMERDLVEAMVSAKKAQCRKLVQACKSIISSADLQRSEYLSIRSRRLKLSEVRYRYRAVRSVLIFLRKELGINMSDELSRASRAISSCNQALKRAEEISTLVAAESVD